VALNPVIKFTTLFGLLAVEIAVTMQSQNLKNTIGGILFVVALFFVHRSFYGMRVPEAREEETLPPAAPAGNRLAADEIISNDQNGGTNGSREYHPRPAVSRP
jgi:hypothetical protein